MKSNRAQVALEYLTTYSWAIFALAIILTTLAQFGVLSPGNILPDRCDLGSNFRCIEHQANINTTTVNVSMSYEGDSVLRNMSNVEMFSEDGEIQSSSCSVYDDNYTNLTTSGVSNFQGIYDYFNIVCQVGPSDNWKSENSKQRFELTFNYRLQGGDFDLSNKGRIVSTVVR